MAEAFPKKESKNKRKSKVKEDLDKVLQQIRRQHFNLRVTKAREKCWRLREEEEGESGTDSEESFPSTESSTNRDSSLSNSPNHQSPESVRTSSPVATTPPPCPPIPSVDSEEEVEMTQQDNKAGLGMFCGNVRKDEGHSDTLHYDVHQWLVDTEARFSTRNNPTDREKITEAVRGTNPKVGDAHRFCTARSTLEIKTWDEFKTLAKAVYRSEAEIDMFLAFKDYSNFTWNNNIVDVGANIHKIVDNLRIGIQECKIKRAKAEFKRVEDYEAGTIVVEVKQIMTLLELGMLYAKMPDGLRRTFTDSEPDIKEPVMNSLTRFRDLCLKRPQDREYLCLPTQETEGVDDIYYGQTNPTYKGGGRWRARGRAWYGNSSRGEDGCYRCHKKGHIARYCRSTPADDWLAEVVCRACHKKGHLERNCPGKQTDTKNVRKWCHFHKTPTHSSAECNRQKKGGENKTTGNAIKRDEKQ